MNATPKAVRATAVSLVLAFGCGSCANVSPEGQAAGAGLISGLATGLIAKSTGMSSGSAAAWGAGVGLATAAVVYVIAKRKATQRQQQLAEQRAAAYMAGVEAGRRERPKTRYIAVKTENAPPMGPAPQGTKPAASVMVFDTHSNQVVGNSVYELKKTPANGEVVKFDTHSAEYVSN